jgi:molecular chaperone HtpG
MTIDAHKETLGFQTEVRQLLDLVIHSLYSNKEIFVRELVSNASDAADKLRFEALTDDALYEGEGELTIWIEHDRDARTVTVRDNGIGMSRQEVVDNVGTIARSGTRQFFQSLSGDQATDTQLIGQFGVGFYSAFIVADRVSLTTRRAGLGPEHGVRWESTGEGEYSIETVNRPERGTEVVLHLRPDQDEFLDGWRLRGIVRKFSDHIALPILMRKEGEENKAEWETVNEATALWARPKGEISDEQYRELYHHLSHDFRDPLAWTHHRVEGTQEYTSLLYIPAHAPFDIWDRRERHGVKLYVRRVFIMDDAEQLMPPYLRFVRGLIDAADLPLNISREILQQNRQIESIRSGSVKKALGLLEHLAKDEPEKYATFWKEFGRVLKEGILEDPANRDRIARLLRFASTRGEGDRPSASLEDYVKRMPEGQEHIYYLTAESYPAARGSPHLEVFERKGVEVLLLTDGVDEWLVSHLTEFEGKPLRSVARGALDLGKLEDEAARQEAEQAAEHLKPFAERIKGVLGTRVQDVRVSHRLTTSPACLVAGDHDLGRHLERLLKATGQAVTAARPVLEVNPSHPLVGRMGAEPDGERFGDWVELLYEQALLAEGGQLEDPSAFVRRMNRMLLELSAAPPVAPSAPAADPTGPAERRDTDA